MKAKKIAINGLFIALVFVTTYLIHIPGPKGYFNVGDALIFVTATVLGRTSGLIAGGIGSAFADLALGYTIYAPFTLIIKGLEGLLAALIAGSAKGKNPFSPVKVLAFAAAALFMVAGYFLVEAFILYTPATALLNVPGNLIQGGASVVIGYLLSGILGGEKLKKYI